MKLESDGRKIREGEVRRAGDRHEGGYFIQAGQGTSFYEGVM